MSAAMSIERKQVARRPTVLTPPAAMAQEARALREQARSEANKIAFAAWNGAFKTNALPLAEYRQF